MRKLCSLLLVIAFIATFIAVYYSIQSNWQISAKAWNLTAAVLWTKLYLKKRINGKPN